MTSDPAPTLTEMREHAKVALARKPVPLDVELLAQDVLVLCGRVEEKERREELLYRAMAPIGGHARGYAQELLAEIGAEIGHNPYDWSSHPDTLAARIALLPKKTQKKLERRALSEVSA